MSISSGVAACEPGVDAQRRRGRAVSAAQAVAERFGIDAIEPVILKDSNNTIVHLSPAPVVAKVDTKTLHQGSQALDREVDILRHLAEIGAPASKPSPLLPPGPHSHEGTRLIFLELLVHTPDARPDAPAAAVALREVHEALLTYRGSLPPLDERFREARALLMNDTAALSPPDRTFLLEAHEMLVTQLSGLHVRAVPLHGDPWIGGNLVKTPTGAALLDFEAACLGPSEWDWSCLPDEVREHAPDLDPKLLLVCGRLRSLCVAVWCWAQPGRATEIDEAAVVHLELLRRALDV